MASQNRSTKGKIAAVVAIILSSVSVLSNLNRHIPFSGPPQSISIAYEVASYRLDNSQHLGFVIPAIKVDVPHAICLYVFAVPDEERRIIWRNSSLYVRPPPHA